MKIKITKAIENITKDEVKVLFEELRSLELELHHMDVKIMKEAVRLRSESTSLRADSGERVDVYSLFNSEYQALADKAHALRVELRQLRSALNRNLCKAYLFWSGDYLEALVGEKSYPHYLKLAAKRPGVYVIFAAYRANIYSSRRFIDFGALGEKPNVSLEKLHIGPCVPAQDENILKEAA